MYKVSMLNDQNESEYNESDNHDHDQYRCNIALCNPCCDPLDASTMKTEIIRSEVVFTVKTAPKVARRNG